MGINIARLPQEQALSELSDGDWHLTLPTGEPDLILTLQWRKQLVTNVSSWYVCWVIKGIQIDIVHDGDPPWDCSGRAYSYPVDSLLLLIRHPTLEAWLTEEYTGESVASYESGMGLFWDTYEHKLDEEIQDAVYHLLKDYWLELHDYPEDFDVSDDPAWDDLCIFELELEQILRLYVGRASTADTWKQYEHIVRAQIEDERRQFEIRQAQHALMSEMVKQFWQHHFSHLVGKRIEYPRFVDMKLEEILVDILADTDPNTVEAIAELGLPGNFSNNVREIIKHIARDVANHI